MKQINKTKKDLPALLCYTTFRCSCTHFTPANTQKHTPDQTAAQRGLKVQILCLFLKHLHQFQRNNGELMGMKVISEMD